MHGSDYGGRIQEKYEAILHAIRARARILVAYSGGIDSSLVLKLAHDAVGDDCLAVIADSPSLPRRELEEAKRAAAQIGAALEVVSLHELDIDEYRENSGLRCYYCRSELGQVLREIAFTRDFPSIADGANLSDVGDYRPGMKAMDENGVWHPLLEFGVDKQTVREMSRWLGLPGHDKPSSPCLSSRIMVGQPITVENLAMIEAGEDYLHELGFRQVRVRCLGTAAKIEVAREDVQRLDTEPLSSSINRRLTEIGFSSVTVDPRGYRTGSMKRRD